MNVVAVGKKAPDFAGTSPDAKTLRLSEHYSKYTLIEFRAGLWRGENPNVIAALPGEFAFEAAFFR